MEEEKTTKADFSRIRGAVFDMDGLMFDTERLVIRMWGEVSKKLGIPIPRATLDRMRGHNARDCEAIFNEGLGGSLDYDEGRRVLNEIREVYYEQYGVPVKKGLKELLAFLHEHGIRTALATSTSRPAAERLLRMAGVENDFDRRVFGDEVENSKPAPDIFLAAAKALDLPPEACMVLEDSFAGIRAAHAAGCVPVMVPDLDEPTPEIEALLAAKCDSLLDVMGLLA